MNIDTTTRKALELLSIYTRRGYLEIYDLAGDAQKTRRQEVMSALMGTKVPIAKAGVTAIKEELHRRLDAQGSCQAARDDDFTAKAKAILAENEKPIPQCQYCGGNHRHICHHAPAAVQLSQGPTTLNVITPRIEHTPAGAQTVITDTPPRKIPDAPLKARRPQTTAPLPLEMPAIDAQQGRLF